MEKVKDGVEEALCGLVRELPLAPEMVHDASENEEEVVPEAPTPPLLKS